MASQTKRDLYTLLNQYKLPKESHEIYTHTKIKGGKYKVPDENLEELYNLLHDDIFVNKNEFNDTLTEANSLITQIKIDLDFKYTTHDDAIRRIYCFDDIEKVALIYMKVIDKYLIAPKDDRIAFIMEKSHAGVWDNKRDPKTNKLIIKDGIHIMFPFITTYYKIALKIREEVLVDLEEIFKSYNFYNNLNDILDISVVHKNNWFLYGCKKAGSPPYLVSKILKFNSDLNIEYLPLTKYSNIEYIRMFSILNKDKTEKWRMAIRDAYKSMLDPENLIIKSDYLKHKQESGKRKKKTIQRTKEELDMICKVIDCLSIFRAEERKPWIELGWCLYNIHNADDTLLKKWIEFSRKDPKYTDTAEEACREVWSNSREDNLGYPTLIMWARIDNKDEYEKIIQNDFGNKLRSFVQRNKLEQNDIAKLMHSLFKNDYVCVCKNKNKYVWFKFERHRWTELGSHSEMRLKLSNVLATKFSVLGEAYLAEYNKLGSGEDNSSQLQDFSTRAVNISKKLRQTGFKNSVITECQDEFINEAKDFIEKMDENPNLIGCNNGVYDLRRLEFRDGRPEDYITLSTKIDYDQNYTWEDNKVIEIMKFISQVLPIATVREYILKVLATTLDGSTKQEKFYIFSGCGGNGKSKLIELLDLTLGDYSKGVSVALLTKKRADSNAANPELFVTKGRRLVKFQEAEENSKINVGLMKEISGGDKITARGLFQDPIEFKPQFKPIFICNDDPELPPNDEGTWRRVRRVEFISRFVDKANPDIKKNEFPIDFDLSEKIKNWPEAFLWILIEYYKKYREEGGIKEPNEVLEYTNIYRRANDMFLEFFNECVTQETNGILTLSDVFREYKAWFKENQQGTGGLKAKRKEDLRTYLIKNLGKEYDINQSMHKIANEKLRGTCWLGYKLNEYYTNPIHNKVNKTVTNLIEEEEDELDDK
jgi:P4 family phage/plasmid primase-like protien